VLILIIPFRGGETLGGQPLPEMVLLDFAKAGWPFIANGAGFHGLPDMRGIDLASRLTRGPGVQNGGKYYRWP
jgi:hypothetical protein